MINHMKWTDQVRVHNFYPKWFQVPLNHRSRKQLQRSNKLNRKGHQLYSRQCLFKNQIFNSHQVCKLWFKPKPKIKTIILSNSNIKITIITTTSVARAMRICGIARDLISAARIPAQCMEPLLDQEIITSRQHRCIRI